MNQYIKLYNDITPLIKGKKHPILDAWREEALATFTKQDFPTKKVERYRYTNIAEAFAPDYGLSLSPIDIKDTPYVYAIKDAPADAVSYYNAVADTSDPLTALNTALTHDAIVIHVPKGTKAAMPIRIENTLEGKQDTMMVRRILIVMDELSEATIFMVDHSGKDNTSKFLTLQVVEVVCKEGAHLDMYELEETDTQNRRFSNLYVNADTNATIRHNNVTLSNGITRNGIDVRLQGMGAHVTLNGAVVADRQQHVDNNTLIDHQTAGCTSNELYKYVLDDDAVCAFAGKILVREGAQQTSSQETNNNMVASDNARMFTQPMLEIYADDVKCAHGSTVGVMDEAALFYMQQRGIPKEVARTLLKNAFISQVIDEMQWTAFRDRMHILIDKRLSKEERCGTCNICK